VCTSHNDQTAEPRERECPPSWIALPSGREPAPAAAPQVPPVRHHLRSRPTRGRRCRFWCIPAVRARRLAMRRSGTASGAEHTSAITKPKPCRRPRTPNPRVLLWADELPEQQSSHHGPVGDEPAVSPATRRRLVAFQLGSDVVGVVDACSRARATVTVLAGGPRQGELSKRIGRSRSRRSVAQSER
jgi:hypothetical protein